MVKVIEEARRVGPKISFLARKRSDVRYVPAELLDDPEKLLFIFVDIVATFGVAWHGQG